MAANYNIQCDSVSSTVKVKSLSMPRRNYINHTPGEATPSMPLVCDGQEQCSVIHTRHNTKEDCIRYSDHDIFCINGYSVDNNPLPEFGPMGPPMVPDSINGTASNSFHTLPDLCTETLECLASGQAVKIRQFIESYL